MISWLPILTSSMLSVLWQSLCSDKAFIYGLFLALWKFVLASCIFLTWLICNFQSRLCRKSGRRALGSRKPAKLDNRSYSLSAQNHRISKLRSVKWPKPRDIENGVSLTDENGWITCMWSYFAGYRDVSLSEGIKILYGKQVWLYLVPGDPGPFSPAMLRLWIWSMTASLSLVTRSRLADPLTAPNVEVLDSSMLNEQDQNWGLWHLNRTNFTFVAIL